jgi:hypothetical protein
MALRQRLRSRLCQVIVCKPAEFIGNFARREEERKNVPK